MRKRTTLAHPAERAAPLATRRDLAALAPGSTRRASTADRYRVRRFAELLEAGEDELSAFWAVASDHRTGYVRFKGATVRPSETTLRRKLGALLARTVPGVVEGAKDAALARLAGLGDEAIRTVAKVVRGGVKDAQLARARLDAARVILASIGIQERSSASSASANVVVSFGDALRAMRHVRSDVRDAPRDD